MEQIGRLVSISTARFSALLAAAAALHVALPDVPERSSAVLPDIASACTVVLSLAALLSSRAGWRRRGVRCAALGFVLLISLEALVQAGSSSTALKPNGLNTAEAAGFLGVAVLLGLLEVKLRPGLDAFFHVVLAALLFGAGISVAWHLAGLTGWARTHAMPLTSAIGTLLLTLSSAAQWDWLRRTDATRPIPAVTRLRFLIVNAIVATVLIGTVSASILLEASVQTVQRNNLAHLAAIQARSVHETLRTADATAETVSTRLQLLRHVRAVNRRDDNGEAILAIRETLHAMVSGEVTGLALFALNGERIEQAGTLGDAKDLHIVLDHARQLHWRDVPMLQRRLVLLDGEEMIGTAVVAVRLPGISTILQDAYGLAPSAETLLCSSHDVKTLACLPHRFSPSVTLRERIREGRPLPIALALDGAAATVSSVDYRGHAVLASLAPIPHHSLALLSKVDQSDLAVPLAHQAVWLGGIVFALAFGLIMVHHLGPSRVPKSECSETTGARAA